MSVTITEQGNRLLVVVHHSRVDGENYILSALTDGQYFKDGIHDLEIDLENVEYINSLGISELVTINRKFLDVRPQGVNFRLLNVDRRVNAILELVEIENIADIHPRAES